MKNKIYHGDAAKVLYENVPDKSIACVYTAPTPPLHYKEYTEDLLGSEKSIDDYFHNIIEILQFVYKKLKDNGSLFVQVGDYIDPETTCYRLIPEMFLMNMSNSWYLKSRIIWDRSAENLIQTDTKRYKRDFEFIYQFVKQPKDIQFINEGNNYWKRSIWDFPCQEIKDGSFASGYPEDLIKRSIIPTTKEGDIVLDPFAGTGVTADVALKYNRKFILIDIDYNQYELLKIKFGKYL